MCDLFDEEESIEHMLTACTHVWALCTKLWRKKALGTPWPRTQLGLILEAPLADFRRIDCQGVIGPTHSIAEIDRRRFAAMNLRLTLDCELTEPKFEKKTLKKHLVLTTWSGILKDEHNLPDD
jgi:hypothetical protein